MRISVFGLGYVGCVSAACFASAGDTVIGVDINPVKVEIINSGKSPIVEPGIGDLIQQSVASGALSATTETPAALQASEISLVCVGTPSRANGALDLAHVEKVCQDISPDLTTVTDHKPYDLSKPNGITARRRPRPSTKAA